MANEKLIQDYYRLSSTSTFDNLSKLATFQDYDLDKAYDEGLNVELLKLLNLDSDASPSEKQAIHQADSEENEDEA